MSKDKMIKVTVIMPSLNVVDYIGQCMESVVSQTLKELEILCIDAGSTDGTLDVIKRYAATDHRIRLIESEKKSYGYQMNLGIKAARGKYIGIVETDDWIDPDMYEILFRRAEEKRADVVKGLAYDIYEKNDGSFYEIFNDYIGEDPVFSEVFSPNDQPAVHRWDGNIWNGIYNKDFLVSHEVFFNESAGAAFQDIGFQQMVLNEASKVLFLHNHFYHYRKVRKGASTWSPKCLRNIYEEYKRLFESGRIKDNRKKWIYGRMVYAFFFELEKALQYSDYDRNSLECPEAVTWFEQEINRAVRDGYYFEDSLNEINKDRYRSFFSDQDKYIADLRTGMERLSSWAKPLLTGSKDKEIVVFGSGNYGKELLVFLIRNGFNVVCLTDNQPWLRNFAYFGVRILSPYDAMRLYPDAIYIIANKNHAIDMEHQLGHEGVSRDRMLIFDGSDELLTKEVKKGTVITKVIGNG